MLRSNKIAGLILAAGYSSRMGVIKALLPFGNEMVIERQLNCFLDAGIQHLFIVVGHEAEKVVSAINNYPVNIIYNKNYNDGMFTSIQAGVRAIDPDLYDGIFLLPVDYPLVSTYTLELMAEHFDGVSSKILYPFYHGQKGHPPLFSTCLAKEILEYRGDTGLKEILARYQSFAEFIDLGNPSCLIDIDTEIDYRQALDYLSSHNVPGMEECTYIYRSHNVSKEIMAHCRKVADTAKILSLALKHKGYNVDPELVFCAGLLHDIEKGLPGHAEKGAEILRKMGYQKLSILIQNHMDLGAAYQPGICNESILYFTDKIINEDKIESLEVRMNKLDCNLIFSENAKKRLETAKIIQEKIETALGEDIFKLLSKWVPING